MSYPFPYSKNFIINEGIFLLFAEPNCEIAFAILNIDVLVFTK